ncbi:MAG: hypothetical protein HYV54_00740 [Parcubacteria group bacterium]|nr:hypothetical protein [Parcubacteria group bacterium]
MISERQKDILWAVIEEHTRMAEPVSSKILATKRGFEIGAPMIRKEMNQLEKEGYLASPHTSAGRVPTDKAYRLYIQENLTSKPATAGLNPKETQKVKESLGKNWEDEQSLLKEISRLTSEISHELGVAGYLGGEGVYTCGFSNLLDDSNSADFDNLSQLARFMDNVDSHFESLWNNFFRDDFGVFVGYENPFKEISEFTLITGRYHLPQGDEGLPAGRQGFVSVIGPKRMNYKRNMALVNYISGCLNSKLQNPNDK